jgi:hypothetical protein
MVQVFVKGLNGETYTFDIDLTANTLRLCEKIQEKLKIPIDTQRLIYSGKQLEHDRPFYVYKIEKEATIHLILRLRGNGDMLKNHILKYHPLNNTIIEPNGVISVFFDKTIKCKDCKSALKLIYIDKPNKYIDGLVLYDSKDSELCFVPIQPMKQGKKLKVEVKPEGLEGPTEFIHTDYSWELTVKKLEPIQICIKMNGDTIPFIFGRFSKNLYNHFIKCVSSILGIKSSQITKIVHSDENIIIESDMDILEIKKDDLITILIEEEVNKRIKME